MKYHQELVAIADCMKIIMEETKVLGHSSYKGVTNDFFLFGSWFALKRLDESVTDVGTELIYIVKTNTKWFCKDNINNMAKYWLGGY